LKTHRQTSFQRYTKNGIIEAEDDIAVESFMELWLEDMHLSSFVSTAGYEKELCLGHLITSGIISSISDIEFLDGWYDALLESMKNADIVYGFSPHPKRGVMPRVPIFVAGQDITPPGCNIAHKKKVFDDVGYIKDTELAEDCDFNYRCVKEGYTIQYNPKMKVYHHHTTNKIGYIKQAFIYGRGRWELNKTHPDLKDRHQHGIGVKNIVRLFVGFTGYISEKIRRGKK